MLKACYEIYEFSRSKTFKDEEEFVDWIHHETMFGPITIKNLERI